MVFAVDCSDTGDGTLEPGTSQARGSVEAEEADKLLVAGMRGAERIVVGTVEDTRAQFAQGEGGGRLIISTVTLSVRESLRGEASSTVAFQLEGGTVGDLALDVSDLPKLQRGHRGVFALRRSLSGDGWVPNRRSLGIVLMDVDGDLSAVRRAEELAR